MKKTNLLMAEAESYAPTIRAVMDLVNTPMEEEKPFSKVLITKTNLERLKKISDAPIEMFSSFKDLFKTVEFENEKMLNDFRTFRLQAKDGISWEQSASLFFALRMSDNVIVSNTKAVIEKAKTLGLSTMSIELFMQKYMSMNDGVLTISSVKTSALFDPRVDEEKVCDALKLLMKGDDCPLKKKSYWIVVCVIFEQMEWIRLRNRTNFISWVNKNFSLDSIVTSNDLKYGFRWMNSENKDLSKCEDNSYSKLAFTLKKMYFGKRIGLNSKFYIYENEQQYLKKDEKIARKN